MLGILGAVAELENDIRRERQRDGIERAKERGVYCRRPASIDPLQIEALASSGLGPAAFARSLNISRASVYRLSGRDWAGECTDCTRQWNSPTSATCCIITSRARAAPGDRCRQSVWPQPPI